MSVPGIPDRFLVAFSLAGEERELVRSIAEAVASEIGRENVFFDEWFKHYIAGADADLRLKAIYGGRCALAVVCVSGRYGGKPWTRAEHAAIRSRQMQATDEAQSLGILPIRVGEGEVAGIDFNAIVPDVRNKGAAEAARLIIDRLRLIVPLPVPELQPASLRPNAETTWFEASPSLQWSTANHGHVREAFGTLLTRDAPRRVLLVCGPSESGKSHVVVQMAGPFSAATCGAWPACRARTSRCSGERP